MRMFWIFFLVFLFGCGDSKNQEVSIKFKYPEKLASELKSKLEVVQFNISDDPPINRDKFEKLEEKIIELFEDPATQKEIVGEIKILLDELENLKVQDFKQKSIQARLVVFKSLFLRMKGETFDDKTSSKNIPSKKQSYLEEGHLKTLVESFLTIKRIINQI